VPFISWHVPLVYPLAQFRSQPQGRNEEADPRGAHWQTHPSLHEKEVESTQLSTNHKLNMRRMYQKLDQLTLGPTT
jgi:hypothetical protein